ncbi:MAG: hypothetical protein ACXWYM_00290 [Candidatus Binatia bacterium]
MEYHEIKTLVREAAIEAVEQGVTNAFERVGIDRRDPLETQKDMAFIRSIRRRRESVWSHITTWGSITVIGAICAAAWKNLTGGGHG